jgi:hypothetical protein
MECPHQHHQHNMGDDGDRRCRVKILTGWSEGQNRFLSSRPCECPGYRGLDPEVDTCCHEWVSASPNCVHCGKMRVR